MEEDTQLHIHQTRCDRGSRRGRHQFRWAQPLIYHVVRGRRAISAAGGPRVRPPHYRGPHTAGHRIWNFGYEVIRDDSGGEGVASLALVGCRYGKKYTN